MTGTGRRRFPVLIASIAALALAMALLFSPVQAQEGSAPDKPRGLTATATDDGVVLTWDDPDDDTITGYMILRRNRQIDRKGEFRELVPDTGTAATTYTDDRVAAGTPYTYRIKAINKHGVSERSAGSTSTSRPPRRPSKATTRTSRAGEDEDGAPAMARRPVPAGRSSWSSCAKCPPGHRASRRRTATSRVTLTWDAPAADGGHHAPRVPVQDHGRLPRRVDGDRRQRAGRGPRGLGRGDESDQRHGLHVPVARGERRRR